MKQITTNRGQILLVEDKTLVEMPKNFNVFSVRYNDVIRFSETENSYMNECFEIIAQLYQPNIKLIEGILCYELPDREDVNELAKKYANKKCPISSTEIGNAEKGYSLAQIENSICKDDFIAGYQAKQSCSEYSESDLENALTQMWFEARKSDTHLVNAISDIIQSLNQSKEIDLTKLEFEMEVEFADKFCRDEDAVWKIKTTTKFIDDGINKGEFQFLIIKK